jgi:hypothetical protein
VRDATSCTDVCQFKTATISLEQTAIERFFETFDLLADRALRQMKTRLFAAAVMLPWSDELSLSSQRFVVVLRRSIGQCLRFTWK